MGKLTQTICRLLPTNCLGEFDHFVGLELKRVKVKPVQFNKKEKKELVILFLVLTAHMSY